MFVLLLLLFLLLLLLLFLLVVVVVVVLVVFVVSVFLPKDTNAMLRWCVPCDCMMMVAVTCSRFMQLFVRAYAIHPSVRLLVDFHCVGT